MSNVGSSHSTPEVMDECVDSSVAKTPIELDKQAHILSHILHHYDLPQVVQCGQNTLLHLRNTGCSLDLRGPLLLYRRRSVRKVSAHILLYDDHKKDFVVVGNDLLIPEDYKGYFAVMGSPDDFHSDQVIPYFSMAGKLAISQCTHFLVGGDCPVTAFRVEGGMRSNIKWVACQLTPGDVLRKGSLFEATSLLKTKSKVPFGHKKIKERKELFMQCFDREDREVILPFLTTGSFFILAQKETVLKHPIVDVKDLLERFTLPLIVKLVHGSVPPVSCCFTGTLLLTDSGVDKTVIASTLLKQRNINLEIPINAGFQFHVAKHTPGLLASRAYDSARKMCQVHAEIYMRNMKVFYTSDINERVASHNSPNLPDSHNQLEQSVHRYRQHSGASTSSKDEMKECGDNVLPTEAPVMSPSRRSPENNSSFICRTAGVMSRWSELASTVTVNDKEHDIFVPPHQRTSPPDRTPPVRRPSSDEKAKGKATGSSVCSDNIKKIKEVLVFQRPKLQKDNVIQIETKTTASCNQLFDTIARKVFPTPPVSEELDSLDGTVTYSCIWKSELKIPISSLEGVSTDDPPTPLTKRSPLNYPGYHPMLPPNFVTDKNDHENSEMDYIKMKPKLSVKTGMMQKDIGDNTENQELIVSEILGTLRLVDTETVFSITAYPNSSTSSMHDDSGGTGHPRTSTSPSSNSPNSSGTRTLNSSDARNASLQSDFPRSLFNLADYNRIDQTDFSANVYDHINPQSLDVSVARSVLSVSQNLPAATSDNYYDELYPYQLPDSAIFVDNSCDTNSITDSGVYTDIIDFPKNETDENDNIASTSKTYVLKELKEKLVISSAQSSQSRQTTSSSSPLNTQPPIILMEYAKHPDISVRASKRKASSPSVDTTTQDVLASLTNADLKPLTIKALRDITPERMNSFLQSEVEELRALLPGVSVIELRKVQMYFRSTAKNVK